MEETEITPITAGELKKILKDIPDDTFIVSWDGFEFESKCLLRVDTSLVSQHGACLLEFDCYDTFGI